jgi:hypothetical protein
MATDARRGCVGGLAITRGGMREMRASACARCAKMAPFVLMLDEAMLRDGKCSLVADIEGLRPAERR